MFSTKFGVFLLATASLLPVAASAQSSGAPYRTGYRWDAQRHLVGEIKADPDGGGTALVSLAARYSYNGEGQLTRIEEGRLATWQDENVAPANWGGFTVTKRIDIAYDAIGRRIRDTSYGDTGAVFAVTQYSYDGDDRLECTATRMNAAIFGALPSSACDPGAAGNDGPDRITKNLYDAAGQLVQVRKALGTSIEQAYASYTFTDNGEQASVTDANGNRASYAYDGFDRRVAWMFPSRASGVVSASCSIAVSEAGDVVGPPEAQGASDDCEKYAYDRNGNRRTLIKRDGQVIRYTYDALNRMATKDVPGSTGDVAFAYDLRGLELSALFPSGQGVSNGYDKAGRPASSTITMGGVSRTLAYQRDANGNRTRLTHPDTNFFSYAYDNMDRLTGIFENGGAQLADIGFDAAGRMNSATVGAVPSTALYDSASHLSALTNDLVNTAQDLTSSFTYNAAGQAKSRTRNNDAYAFNGYADVDRPYAANGLNQYTAAGELAFGYDRNGNLTSDGSTIYGYDAENRLVSATGATNASLTYDPAGRLFELTSGSTTTRFLYDGDELVAEYDGAGALLHRYVHGAKEDDPLIWYLGSAVGAENRRSLQVDLSGSVVSVADSSGAAIAINAYDEYGIPKGADGQLPANLGRFQYTGQIWIPELRMYHYKARLYSPTLGRFLQTDPIGYEDQVNLYAYVGNEPINGRDPRGLYECRGTTEECAAINGYVTKAQEALTKLDPNSNQARRLDAALKYLGAANTRNGVTLVARHLATNTLASASRGNIINVDVSQIGGFGTNRAFMGANPGLKSEDISNALGAGAIAHEAQHELDFKAGGFPTSRQSEYRLELNGYRTEQATHQGTGVTTGLWSPAMTQQELDTAVANGAKGSTDTWCRGNRLCR